MEEERIFPIAMHTISELSSSASSWRAALRFSLTADEVNGIWNLPVSSVLQQSLLLPFLLTYCSLLLYALHSSYLTHASLQ